MHQRQIKSNYMSQGRRATSQIPEKYVQDPKSCQATPFPFQSKSTLLHFLLIYKKNCKVMSTKD